MRLCRYESQSQTHIGFYMDTHVLPLRSAFLKSNQPGLAEEVDRLGCTLPFLPPSGMHWKVASKIALEIESSDRNGYAEAMLDVEQIHLLPPIARPNKLLLLAGNYTEHIHEQGDRSGEREHTFPYVFSKPPSTTLIGSGASFCIPSVSPNKIDYELELAVIIGKTCRAVAAADALQYVAGYTVINDISDRGFRPNPQRQERPRDKHFDWLHGKWHDRSCPCGPCIVTADAIDDPQALSMQLSIDGELRQNASTNQQVFSVAEVIAFISSFVTLEAGDIISTGTPAGVGNATGRYLQPGQLVLATIEKIGTLETKIVGE